jgi:hypothetical protein
MHLNLRSTHLLILAASLFGAVNLQAQHGHLNAGAVGQNQGDRLSFANGGLFAESSGYVKSLPQATTGKYAGFYSGGITITALPTSIDNGGPAAGASAPGSFLMIGIQSVTGPVGGDFAFWEEGATAPTLSYSVGYDVAVPTSLWAISDASGGAGAAGADPFGHLHGRNFTATVPGDYLVGFKLFDNSGNGTGGGAIHTPSATLNIRFSAVPEPSVGVLLALGAAGLVLVHRRKRA